MTLGAAGRRRGLVAALAVLTFLGLAVVLIRSKRDRARDFSGVQLAVARRTLAIDERLVTLEIDRNCVTVEGVRVALSDDDALPSIHDALRRAASLVRTRGGDPTTANVIVDARTPFSRVASVSVAVRTDLARMMFVVRGADGVVGTLVGQPLSTPAPVCILGVSPDAGGIVIERAWYEIPERLREVREAEDVRRALLRAAGGDAALEAVAPDQPFDAGGGPPCAYACRDGCAPVLAPGLDAPFGDVVVALEEAASAWPGVCVAWQPIP